MPARQFKNAPGLDITFAPDSPPVVYPGQTLSGKATLSTAGESVSIGSVKATVYARAKVKVFQSYGQSSAVYKSRAVFFAIEQELFKSDYTYGPGDYSWPFNLQMPFVPDQAYLVGKKRDRFKPNEHYYSTDDIDIVEHQMPPTMRHVHRMFGRAVWAHVEYVLEVTVTEAAGTHTLRSPQSKTSIRPINFQPGSREEVITNWNLCNQQEQIVIKSSRLSDVGNSAVDGNGQRLSPVPSNELIARTRSSSTSPSRGLFSKLSLSSSSNPRLTIDCLVRYPTTLQVYHPDGIPLFLSITPNLNGQATTIDTLPQVRIKSFSFAVLCTTRCRALTGLWQEHDSKTISIHLAKDVPLSHAMRLTAPTPSAERSEKSEKAPSPSPSLNNNINDTDNTINLSTLHPLRLISAKLGYVHEPIVNPTFKTYNIAREYGLKYSIEIEIVTPQKTFTEKIKGEVPRGGVTVRGIPDSLRAQAMIDTGMTALDYSAAAANDDEVNLADGRYDDDDDEDADEVAEGDSSGRHGGAAEKRGLKGLLRRSHGGPRSSKKAGKEQEAREDRQRAGAEGEQQHHPNTPGAPPGSGEEQLPKYEA